MYLDGHRRFGTLPEFLCNTPNSRENCKTVRGDTRQSLCVAYPQDRNWDAPNRGQKRALFTQNWTKKRPFLLMRLLRPAAPISPTAAKYFPCSYRAHLPLDHSHFLDCPDHRFVLVENENYSGGKITPRRCLWELPGASPRRSMINIART